jgi:uncharacterized protein (TIGR00730 family)
MTRPSFSICVYCGSKPGTNPLYAQAAVAVGQWIAGRGGQLVYGGGSGGLMGVVADATLAAGGRVVGIIPKALVEKEWAHHGCTELHIVENMHDRKRMMAERADAFLALPGGIGTLEELFEVWTWRQLGYHDKPIGLLNTAGYYNGLLAFLHNAVASQFLGDWQMGLIRASDDPAYLLGELIQTAGFSHTSQLDQI